VTSNEKKFSDHKPAKGKRGSLRKSGPEKGEKKAGRKRSSEIAQKARW